MAEKIDPSEFSPELPPVNVTPEAEAPKPEKIRPAEFKAVEPSGPVGRAFNALNPANIGANIAKNAAKENVQKGQFFKDTDIGKTLAGAYRGVTGAGNALAGKYNVQPETPGFLTEGDVYRQDTANKAINEAAQEAAGVGVGFMGTPAMGTGRAIRRAYEDRTAPPPTAADVVTHAPHPEAPVPNVRPESNARLLSPEVSHAPLENNVVPRTELPQRAGVGAEGAAGPLDNVSPSTMNYLLDLAREEGLTPWTVEQRMSEMSPHQFLFEHSPNFEHRFKGMAQWPGQSRNEVVNTLEQRHAEAPQRIRGALDEALGPVQNLAQERELLSIQQERQAGPLYRQFRSMQIPPTEEMNALMPRLRAAGAFGQARKLAAIEGRPWQDAFINNELDVTHAPTTESWDLVKRALDAKIEASLTALGKPTVTTRALQGLKQDLIRSIDEHPNQHVGNIWRMAREAFASPAQIKSAHELGQRILTEGVDAEGLVFQTSGYNQAQMDALAAGIRKAIDKKLGKAGPTQGAVVRDLMGENNQAKIRWIIGDERADKLFAAIEHEHNMHNVPGRIYKGSETSGRESAKQEFGPQSNRLDFIGNVITAGMHLIGHNPVGAATSLASKHAVAQSNRAKDLAAARFREEFARLGMLQGPERDAVMHWLAENLGQTPRKVGGRVLSDAQKEAGNYQKKHINWHGLDLSIETEKGEDRTGVDAKGKPWSVTMPVDYGYIKRTEGNDGDHVDVFVCGNSPKVFVIDQQDHKTKKFDEHKCMLGAATRDDAIKCYHKSFSDGKGPQRIKSVKPMQLEQFKRWVFAGKKMRPVGRFAGGRVGYAEGGAPELTAPDEEGERYPFVQAPENRGHLAAVKQAAKPITDAAGTATDIAKGAGNVISNLWNNASLADMAQSAYHGAQGPGNALQGRYSPEPETPGFLTEGDVYRQDMAREAELKHATDLGGTVIGGSMPFAQKGAVGFGGGDLRVSTRLPTGKKSLEDPLGPERLTIDTEALKRDPSLFAHNVGLVRAYPNLPLKDIKGSPEKVSDSFINHVKDNLLFLHDEVPPEIRKRSAMWYEGGNRLAHELADKYNISPSSSAASIAALSPQKDWFQNVSLAHRVHEIHFNRGNEPFSPEMADRAKIIYAKPALQPYVKAMEGKSYNELSDPIEKALWLRLYDESHFERGHPLITPEGYAGDFVKTKAGNNASVAWGSGVEIAKAIKALEANGDIAKITPLLGERHKVRNFYNNIIAPNSPHGDVTIDTHAVAAGLMRPLSGNSLEVAHNFGNYPGANLPTARSSAISGVQGTYPLYADAYRQAAKERGILPRQMQSITWEAARGLFTDTFKTQANAKLVDDVWKNYQKGVISLHDARAKILKIAGGINHPDWWRSSHPVNAPTGSSGHAAELSGHRVPHRNAEAVDPGTGARTSSGNQARALGGRLLASVGVSRPLSHHRSARG